jgi:phenylalanyl-tRNA synthetase beta chain
MNISTSWLREWVDPDVSDELLAESLTMAGLEVDSISSIAPPFKDVVVGMVVDCVKHPNADKLSLCQVDVGGDSNLQIVCGANNIRKDLKVIVAKVGAVLPNGLKIKKAKLRDYESCGMICSESELAISEESDGIAELPENSLIGQEIRQCLDLDDNIIELDITPNRGDCFSVMGIAREVCANYNISMNVPKFDLAVSSKDKVKRAIVVDSKACPKYLTRTIKGIDNSVSTPEWMVNKLKRSGQQTHSPVVDITNYVLLEMGQPMHAFDLSKINGDIQVRMANNGEKINLLNEQTVKLNSNTLVIADDDGPLGIAGVMGGMRSSTQSNTNEVLLESAYFDLVSIAGKAREYGLHTESSLRFERGVDFNVTPEAMERATQLIIDICGGHAGKINESTDKKNLPNIKPISITKDKIDTVLGFELESRWIEEKFINLDFEIKSSKNNSWTVLPPSFRFDIRIAADLIEELARLYGYDKIPVKKLTIDSDINSTSESFISKYDLSQSLVNRGYQEVITYSFISEHYHDLISPNVNKIVLSNPISSDMSVMRSSLWSGLLHSVESNQRRGHLNARFFEAGLCFDGVKDSQQSEKIAGIIIGNRYPDQWSETTREVDFFDIKSDVESLLSYTGQRFNFEEDEHSALQKGQTAKILLSNKQVGWVGALSPFVQNKLSLARCFLFELDLKSIQDGDIAKYQKLSPYQASSRDIAVVVDQDIITNNIISSIRNVKQDFLIDVGIFDVYIGKNIDSGKKSVAINLSYQSPNKTLTDEQVNEQVSDILEMLKLKYQAIQR